MTNNRGTPANGYTKPYIRMKPTTPPLLSAREAVTRYGDDWRSMLDSSSPYKRDGYDDHTRDFREFISMVHMERGLRARVDRSMLCDD